jgi:hypothetical protein
MAVQKTAVIDRQTAVGREIQNNFLTGLGAGGTAMGLMALYRHLRAKQEAAQKTPPTIDAVAMDAEIPRSFLNKKKPEKKAFNLSSLRDAVPYALPIAGAAGGAALGAATAPNKKEKKKRMLQGAGVGGLIGGGTALFGTDAGARALEKIVSAPDRLLTWGNSVDSTEPLSGWLFEGNEGRTVSSPSEVESPWGLYAGARTLANLTAGLGGAGLGLYGVKKILDNSDKKREDREDAVGDARKDYFKGLLSKESADGKALSAVADLALSAEEKKADEYSDPNHTSITNPDQMGRSALKFLTNLATVPMFATMGGVGAVAAKLMYDKTRAASKDRQLAQARRHYNRMRPMRNVWVDPQELAAVKEVVDSAS